MSAAAPGDEAPTIRIAARLDRRSTEAFVLELRRRLKQLGHHGVQITVTPAGETPPSPPLAT